MFDLTCDVGSTIMMPVLVATHLVLFMGALLAGVDRCPARNIAAP